MSGVSQSVSKKMCDEICYYMTFHYIMYLCNEVYDSKNDQISMIQNFVSIPEKDEWKHSISMVINYLKEHKMNNTIRVIAKELLLSQKYLESKQSITLQDAVDIKLRSDELILTRKASEPHSDFSNIDISIINSDDDVYSVNMTNPDIFYYVPDSLSNTI